MAHISSRSSMKLKSSDGSVFEVEEEVASMSATVKNLLDDTDVGEDAPIPLANVAAPVLAKVIEFCTYHVRANKVKEEDGKPHKSEEETKAWDKQFAEDLSQAMLFDLILAANYMDIKGLLNLTCQTVANMIKGKTPEEIRKTFNIQNDWTPEEEEEVKREQAWAFD